MKKRNFLKLSGIVTTGLLLNPTLACTTRHPDGNAWIDPILMAKGIFTVPALGFAFNALEPHIDAMTMEIHHDKHHDAYVKKLNDAVKGSAVFADKSLGEILATITKDTPAVRNNGGGHYNHSLFWSILGANASKPEGKLLEAINTYFASYDKMVLSVIDTGMKVFGSGWVWISIDKEKRLILSSTPNQDNPLMTNIVETKGLPLFGIDVWEHAYYLKYTNERKKYLEAIFNVLDWKKIGERYTYLTA